jgi:hypothetical protein
MRASYSHSLHNRSVRDSISEIDDVVYDGREGGCVRIGDYFVVAAKNHFPVADNVYPVVSPIQVNECLTRGCRTISACMQYDFATPRFCRLIQRRLDLVAFVNMNGIGREGRSR